MPEGKDTGWRFWNVQDGILVSPFALVPLASTGLAESRSGIAYWPKVEDIHRAIDVFALTDEHAITFGLVSGLKGVDPHTQTYRANGWIYRMPTSYRAQRYQVTHIFADTKVDYELLTRPLGELPTC